MKVSYLPQEQAAWRYDPNTHNIVDCHGEIIARVGDNVYAKPDNIALLVAAPKLYEALLGMSAYHDSKFRSNRIAAIQAADAALDAAQPIEPQPDRHGKLTLSASA
ncbi:hypothetical protein CCP3SC15_5840003 [Gammaproteobacteria bacterium]